MFLLKIILDLFKFIFCPEDSLYMSRRSFKCSHSSELALKKNEAIISEENVRHRKGSVSNFASTEELHSFLVLQKIGETFRTNDEQIKG